MNRSYWYEAWGIAGLARRERVPSGYPPRRSGRFRRLVGPGGFGGLWLSGLTGSKTGQCFPVERYTALLGRSRVLKPKALQPLGKLASHVT